MTIYSFIALIGYMSGMLHAYHVSVCEINFNNDTQNLEITQRVFLDDLEEGLNLWSGKSHLDLLQPKDKSELDALLKSYFMSHFEISIDGKSQTLEYLGTQSRGDVLLFFAQIPRIKKMQKMEVKNSMLMELFADQVNLVHVTRNDKLQSIKLDAAQPTGSVSWND